MDKIKLLDQLKIGTNDLIEITAKEFLAADAELLDARPAPSSWSAYECFEHMGIANKHYRAEFKKKVMSLDGKVQSDAPDFKPGILGNYFVNSMTPKVNGEIPSRMKTLKVFRPKGEQNGIVIQQFVDDQRFFLDVIEKSRNLNLTKIKIVSALGRIVTFKLGDALRFITGHNQRHMIQAQRAIEMAKSMTS